MFKSMVAVTVYLALSLTAFPQVSVAQNSERGTTLVCYAGGGDGIYLVEWTTDQVEEYESKTGQDVTDLEPHPRTGNCYDFAGLMGGWVPSIPLRCKQDSEGRWYGPIWVYPWNRIGAMVPPDPATGGCPQLATPYYGQVRTELERVAVTAVHLTELEVSGDYDRLYAWMHPDSKAIVPQAAMEGWYREVFAGRPPVWMTVDNVQVVEWTWDVTGKVYPSAAEVSFRQRFEDGQETAGAAHLVRDNGVWRWFFGADRSFVDKQIARFPGSRPEIEEGTLRPQATLPPAEATKSGAYTVLDLGTGNGNWSSADHINSAGTVLWSSGMSRDPLTNRVENYNSQIWLIDNTLDLSEAGVGNAIAINDRGVVLAHGLDPQDQQPDLYRVDSGEVIPLPGLIGGYPADINNEGAITGSMAGSAFIFDDGSLQHVPGLEGFTTFHPAALNDSRYVAGTASEDLITADSDRAVLYADGAFTVLDPAPGSDSSSASDVSDAGHVVGGPGVAGMHEVRQYGRAFLYDHSDGSTTDIGSLPGYQNSVATAVNNMGLVAGYAWLPTAGAEPFRRAFIYDHRTGKITDLNQLIPEGSGWQLVDALDINDAGQIVGRGLVNGEMHAFVLSPTTVPDSTVPTPPIGATATFIPASTATVVLTPTALRTSTPSPTATPLPTPTISAAPTPSPSSITSQASLGCQLVELYPGNPGYRGYVAGIDGPGEVACLADLVATNPGFDKAAEDAANLTAARAIGLAGSPRDWTWENWMAIEAERGLPATCYSCLFTDLGSSPQRRSAAWNGADERLRMGGYGSSEAIVQAATGAGMGPNATAFFVGEFDPNDQDNLGPDHVLRAFIGLSWPGHHAAPEMVDAYDELFAALGGEGTLFFDPALMWDTVLAQGGYAPTPPTASIEDQLYMVRTSLEAICYTGNCGLYLYDQIIEPGYLSEVRASGQDLSLRDWLREELGNPFRN